MLFHDLKDQVAQQNRIHDIEGIVSGKDSCCNVRVSMPDSKNRIGLFAENEGKYPVYDVSIEILDVEKSSVNMKKLTEDEIFDALAERTIENYQVKKIVKLGTFGPQMVADLGVIKLPDADKQTFHITVTARYGSYNKLYQYRRINGKWVRAIQTVKNGKKERKLIPSFPVMNREKSNGIKILW